VENTATATVQAAEPQDAPEATGSGPESPTGESTQLGRIPPRPEPSPGWIETARPAVVATASAAAIVGIAAVTAGILRGRGAVPVADGESILLSARPRKVVARYLATLGLWESARRAQRFTLTDRRVIIESGLISRASRSLPLSQVTHVDLRTGPWQGFVELSRTAGSGGLRREEIGPLRSIKARAFAEAIIREMAGHTGVRPRLGT
jgi:membrane protein YdbS with pleckstrin-like domain